MHTSTKILNFAPNYCDMKRLVFFFSIALLLCPGRAFANTSDQKVAGQDIYITGHIDTLMLESEYFDFKRKVFVYLPPLYRYFDATDFDVVYTTDAQTMEQFFMAAAMPSFQNQSKWFIVVGICSPQMMWYSRQDDFLPNDSATIRSHYGRGGHSGAD